MFTALLLKHLRQGRAILLAGVGVSIAIPVLLAAAVAWGRPLPFFGFITGSSRELGLVLLAGFAWPVFTTALTLQIVGGDLASGTEPFLGTRPVRAWVVAAARLVATIAAAFTVIVVGLGTVLLVEGVGTMAGDDESLRMVLLALFAVELVPLAGALVAVAAGAGGIAGFVLALVVDGALFSLNYFASKAYPIYVSYTATWMGVAPLAWAVLLLLAMGAAGEPSGRGRWRRGTAATAGAWCAIVPLFVGGASWLLHRPPRSNDVFVQASPAPSGSVMVGAWTEGLCRGWLVSARDGKRTTFFAPQVDAAGWKPDGSLLALVTHTGSPGSEADDAVVRVVTPEGRDAFPPVALGGRKAYPTDVIWAGDRVVVRGYPGYNADLVWAVIPGGKARVIPFERENRSAPFLLGSTPDGSTYFTVTDGAEEHWPPRRIFGESNPDSGSFAVHVLRLAPGAYRLEELRVVHVANAPRNPKQLKLSPSGRLLLAGSQVIDLATGGDVSFGMHEPVWQAQWLNGDRLLFTDGPVHEARLHLGTAGEEPRTLQRFGNWMFPTPSPDGTRILVSAIGKAGTHGKVEYLVYDIAADRWTTIETHEYASGSTADVSVWWATSDTLLRAKDGAFELLPLAHPDQPRRIWN